jgi:hypothetical protein
MSELDFESMTYEDYARLVIEANKGLVSYLRAHEADIARGIDDYESLYGMFKLIMGRTLEPAVVH